jgi:hypothetical protein
MITLPESCIRGPELFDPVRIAAELRGADALALQAYANGVSLLGQAHMLLAFETRLAEAKRTRDFLIGQLVSLEMRDTALFDAALASYRDGARSEEPPCHSRCAPLIPD